MRWLVLLLAFSLVQDKPKPKPPDKIQPAKADYAVRAGLLYTGTGAPIQNALILVRRGRIIQVAAAGKFAAPPNTKIIDASRKVVIPGLIDSASYLFQRLQESGSNAQAHHHILDGIDPYQEDWKEAVAQGVTTVYLHPANRGTVRGLGALVRLNGQKGRRFVLKPAAALHLALGVTSSDTSSRQARYNAWKSMKTMFTGAQKYKDMWDKYAKDLAAWKKAVTDWGKKKKEAEAKKAKVPPPPKSPKKPAPNDANSVLSRTLGGSLPVRMTAHHAESIEYALDLAKEFKLKLILDQATEAPKVADKIVAAKVPVIVGPVFRYGLRRVDYLNHGVDCAAAMGRSKITFAIASFPDPEAGHSGNGATRFLAESAACAASKGLSTEEALASITSTPAAILGVGNEVGTIAPGRRADFVILSGAPFAPDTRVEQTWVDGKKVYPE